MCPNERTLCLEKALWGGGAKELKGVRGSHSLGITSGSAHPGANINAINCAAQHTVLDMTDTLTSSDGMVYLLIVWTTLGYYPCLKGHEVALWVALKVVIELAVRVSI